MSVAQANEFCRERLSRWLHQGKIHRLGAGEFLVGLEGGAVIHTFIFGNKQNEFREYQYVVEILGNFYKQFFLNGLKRRSRLKYNSEWLNVFEKFIIYYIYIFFELL